MEKRFAAPLGEGKPALLTKEECIDCFSKQTQIKCDWTLNLVKRPAATTPEEKKARLHVMDAEMEDELFKQTGHEMQHLNESIVRTKLAQDPDFIKVATEAS